MSPQSDDTPAATFRVVGVGASAGGLESLERLFSRLPADTGMAFVVLQHLSPDFKSLMAELLARRTSMAVRAAEHEMKVEADAVYLLPPMKEMIIRQRRLLLADKDPRHRLALPIDLFLRSLAQDVGEHAVAVILSGSGSDGSRGVQEVSRAGGLVFCETPDTAKFSGMPVSAMRAGVVDQVLPPEGIADALATLSRTGRLDAAAGVSQVPDDGVETIMRLLRDECAIDFSHYKSNTVTRRIERRLAMNRSMDLETYVARLRADPRELNSLYEDLLIGVTRFFRDEDAFEILAQTIIPDIIERTPPDEQIRVWVAGCATGQEAYSVAMLMHEQLAARERPVTVKILATDVHKASLEAAAAGLYTDAQIVGVSPERLQRFFTKRPNGYQISHGLRETIVFAPHNLIRDAPFTRLDLITCRNLLIYFEPPAQKTVLTLFHFGLKPGGILFLGSSESPGGLVDEFDSVDEHHKIYRKRRDLALPRDLKLPLARGGASPLLPPVRHGNGANAQLLALYDRLLDRFMPPSFLLERDGQLLDTFGGAESLLRVKPRRPSSNVLEMLGDDLRTLISGALHRLRRDAEPVRFAAVTMPGRAERATLSADPIRDSHGNVTHILLAFEPESDPAQEALRSHSAVPATSPVHLGALSQEQTRALQDELAYTKENLQATIEELETTNEELQATNEELMASNEELQSTNEELHSVNEELYTVNAEYQKKNSELQELNDDIEHLLDRTDVGTMFLDRDLCIRKFTPRIVETFDVIPGDVGRPLRSFSHRLAYATLIVDVERVLADGGTVEAQTWDDRGRTYFLRILPYRARTPKRAAGAGDTPSPAAVPTASDGVVITLTDISALEQARSRIAQLSAIVESSGDAIIGKTLDGTITSWNDGATRLYGYSEREAVGRHVSSLYPPEQRGDVEMALAEVRRGRPVERLEAVRVRKDGTLIDVSVIFSPILDSSNAIVGVSAISRDITPLVCARREIIEREERIRLLLDSTAEAIYGIDLSGVCTFCNPACARLLGFESPAALIGKQMHALAHHTRADGSPYPPEQSPIYESLRHREQAHVDDEVLWRADGTSFPAEYWSHPIRRGDDVIGAVVTFFDITERKEAEREIQEGVHRREQFLAMLSHELRNPLAAILNATYLLGLNDLPEDCDKASQVVERQAKHMARLLDDLLDVARITRGRILLDKRTVDLRESARSAIEALGPFFVGRETQLTVELPDEPVIVVGDAARLQQIQANLLSNAAKYSPRGSKVHFVLRRDDGQAVIRVADQGQGIDPDMLPRIFDLFVQGHQPLDRADGGLGIGLTLLRSLVELHDGRVEAQSDGPGKGSVFTVCLPLAAKPAHAQASPADPDRLVESVVVVEDQEDSREMMRVLLESAGVSSVATAGNGLEGAELIERLKPQVALVDLGLPVMNGFDLARRIRQSGLPTRLVALSGYGQDADIQAAMAAGFDQHVTKPTDLARLKKVLLAPPSP